MTTKRIFFTTIAIFVSFLLGFIIGINSVVVEEYMIVPGTVIEHKTNNSNYI